MPTAPAIESSVREGEEPVRLPPTVQINKLSDRFKEALARDDKPPEKAAEPPEPKVAEVKSDKPPEKAVVATPKQDKPDPKEQKPSREHFKVLETQRDEFKTKWEQAEERAKQNEAKAKEVESKIPNDYEELKGKLSKHEEFMQKFYVEQSPQFQAAFDQKIAAGIEEAREVVGSANADRVADLLSMPPSTKRDAEIDEITADLSPFRQAALVRAFQDVRKLQKERAGELAKTAENYKNLKNVESQRATQEKLSRQEALEQAYKLTASESAKQTVHFRKIEGNDEHNARVDENEKMLKEFTTSDLSPADHARLAAWAVRGMRSSQTDTIKDALIQKLQDELKAIGDANPSAQGGGSKTADKQKPKTAGEKYREAMTQGIPES